MNKIIALLIVSAAAVELTSIPAGSLMQNNPSHWKKTWPEGIVDNADGDADVLNQFTTRPKEKKTKGLETYPWAHSEEVLETQASLKTAADITK